MIVANLNHHLCIYYILKVIYGEPRAEEFIKKIPYSLLRKFHVNQKILALDPMDL